MKRKIRPAQYGKKWHDAEIALALITPATKDMLRTLSKLLHRTEASIRLVKGRANHSRYFTKKWPGYEYNEFHRQIQRVRESLGLMTV
jgi:hypothetical protein